MGHQRKALLGPGGLPLGGALAAQDALDLEEGVDAAHRLQRQRRDDDGLIVLGLGRDVGEHEELAPRVSPTGGLDQRPRTSAGLVELAVAAVSVSLEDARPPGQVFLGVLSRPVARIVEHRRRRVRAREGAIVAHIGPEPGLVAPALGQDRNGGVVAVQALDRQDVSLDAIEEGA